MKKTFYLAVLLCACFVPQVRAAEIDNVLTEVESNWRDWDYSLRQLLNIKKKRKTDEQRERYKQIRNKISGFMMRNPGLVAPHYKKMMRELEGRPETAARSETMRRLAKIPGISTQEMQIVESLLSSPIEAEEDELTDLAGDAVDALVADIDIGPTKLKTRDGVEYFEFRYRDYDFYIKTPIEELATVWLEEGAELINCEFYLEDDQVLPLQGKVAEIKPKPASVALPPPAVAAPPVVAAKQILPSFPSDSPVQNENDVMSLLNRAGKTIFTLEKFFKRSKGVQREDNCLSAARLLKQAIAGSKLLLKYSQIDKFEIDAGSVKVLSDRVISDLSDLCLRFAKLTKKFGIPSVHRTFAELMADLHGEMVVGTLLWQSRAFLSSELREKLEKQQRKSELKIGEVVGSGLNAIGRMLTFRKTGRGTAALNEKSRQRGAGALRRYLVQRTRERRWNEKTGKEFYVWQGLENSELAMLGKVFADALTFMRSGVDFLGLINRADFSDFRSAFYFLLDRPDLMYDLGSDARKEIWGELISVVKASEKLYQKRWGGFEGRRVELFENLAKAYEHGFDDEYMSATEETIRLGRKTGWKSVGFKNLVKNAGIRLYLPLSGSPSVEAVNTGMRQLAAQIAQTALQLGEGKPVLAGVTILIGDLLEAAEKNLMWRTGIPEALRKARFFDDAACYFEFAKLLNFVAGEFKAWPPGEIELLERGLDQLIRMLPRTTIDLLDRRLPEAAEKSGAQAMPVYSYRDLFPQGRREEDRVLSQDELVLQGLETRLESVVDLLKQALGVAQGQLGHIEPASDRARDVELCIDFARAYPVVSGELDVENRRRLLKYVLLVVDPKLRLPPRMLVDARDDVEELLRENVLQAAAAISPDLERKFLSEVVRLQLHRHRSVFGESLVSSYRNIASPPPVLRSAWKVFDGVARGLDEGEKAFLARRADLGVELDRLLFDVSVRSAVEGPLRVAEQLLAEKGVDADRYRRALESLQLAIERANASSIKDETIIFRIGETCWRAKEHLAWTSGAENFSNLADHALYERFVRIVALLQRGVSQTEPWSYVYRRFSDDVRKKLEKAQREADRIIGLVFYDETQDLALSVIWRMVSFKKDGKRERSEEIRREGAQALVAYLANVKKRRFWLDFNRYEVFELGKIFSGALWAVQPGDDIFGLYDESRSQFAGIRTAIFAMLNRFDLMRQMSPAAREKIFERLVELGEKSGREVLRYVFDRRGPIKSTLRKMAEKLGWKFEEKKFLSQFVQTYKKCLYDRAAADEVIRAGKADEDYFSLHLTNLIFPGLDLFISPHSDLFLEHSMRGMDELAAIAAWIDERQKLLTQRQVSNERQACAEVTAFIATLLHQAHSNLGKIAPDAAGNYRNKLVMFVRKINEVDIDIPTSVAVRKWLQINVGESVYSQEELENAQQQLRARLSSPQNIAQQRVFGAVPNDSQAARIFERVRGVWHGLISITDNFVRHPEIYGEKVRSLCDAVIKARDLPEDQDFSRLNHAIKKATILAAKELALSPGIIDSGDARRSFAALMSSLQQNGPLPTPNEGDSAWPRVYESFSPGVRKLLDGKLLNVEHLRGVVLGSGLAAARHKIWFQIYPKPEDVDFLEAAANKWNEVRMEGAKQLAAYFEAKERGAWEVFNEAERAELKLLLQPTGALGRGLPVIFQYDFSDFNVFNPERLSDKYAKYVGKAIFSILNRPDLMRALGPSVRKQFWKSLRELASMSPDVALMRAGVLDSSLLKTHIKETRTPLHAEFMKFFSKTYEAGLASDDADTIIERGQQTGNVGPEIYELIWPGLNIFVSVDQDAARQGAIEAMQEVAKFAQLVGDHLQRKSVGADLPPVFAGTFQLIGEILKRARKNLDDLPSPALDAEEGDATYDARHEYAEALSKLFNLLRENRDELPYEDDVKQGLGLLRDELDPSVRGVIKEFLERDEPDVGLFKEDKLRQTYTGREIIPDILAAIPVVPAVDQRVGVWGDEQIQALAKATGMLERIKRPVKLGLGRVEPWRIKIYVEAVKLLRDEVVDNAKGLVEGVNQPVIQEIARACWLAKEKISWRFGSWDINDRDAYEAFAQLVVMLQGKEPVGTKLWQSEHFAPAWFKGVKEAFCQQLDDALVQAEINIGNVLGIPDMAADEQEPWTLQAIRRAVLFKSKVVEDGGAAIRLLGAEALMDELDVREEGINGWLLFGVNDEADVHEYEKVFLGIFDHLPSGAAVFRAPVAGPNSYDEWAGSAVVKMLRRCDLIRVFSSGIRAQVWARLANLVSRTGDDKMPTRSELFRVFGRLYDAWLRVPDENPASVQVISAHAEQYGFSGVNIADFIKPGFNIFVRPNPASFQTLLAGITELAKVITRLAIQLEAREAGRWDYPAMPQVYFELLGALLKRAEQNFRSFSGGSVHRQQLCRELSRLFNLVQDVLPEAAAPPVVPDGFSAVKRAALARGVQLLRGRMVILPDVIALMRRFLDRDESTLNITSDDKVGYVFAANSGEFEFVRALADEDFGGVVARVVAPDPVEVGRQIAADLREAESLFGEILSHKARKHQEVNLRRFQRASHRMNRAVQSGGEDPAHAQGIAAAFLPLIQQAGQCLAWSPGPVSAPEAYQGFAQLLSSIQEKYPLVRDALVKADPDAMDDLLVKTELKAGMVYSEILPTALKEGVGGRGDLRNRKFESYRTFLPVIRRRILFDSKAQPQNNVAIRGLGAEEFYYYCAGAVTGKKWEGFTPVEVMELSRILVGAIKHLSAGETLFGFEGVLPEQFDRLFVGSLLLILKRIDLMVQLRDNEVLAQFWKELKAKVGRSKELFIDDLEAAYNVGLDDGGNISAITKEAFAATPGGVSIADLILPGFGVYPSSEPSDLSGALIHVGKAVTDVAVHSCLQIGMGALFVGVPYFLSLILKRAEKNFDLIPKVDPIIKDISRLGSEAGDIELKERHDSDVEDEEIVSRRRKYCEELSKLFNHATGKVDHSLVKKNAANLAGCLKSSFSKFDASSQSVVQKFLLRNEPDIRVSDAFKVGFITSEHKKGFLYSSKAVLGRFVFQFDKLPAAGLRAAIEESLEGYLGEAARLLNLKDFEDETERFNTFNTAVGVLGEAIDLSNREKKLGVGVVKRFGELCLQAKKKLKWGKLSRGLQKREAFDGFANLIVTLQEESKDDPGWTKFYKQLNPRVRNELDKALVAAEKVLGGVVERASGISAIRRRALFKTQSSGLRQGWVSQFLRYLTQKKLRQNKTWISFEPYEVEEIIKIFGTLLDGVVKGQNFFGFELKSWVASRYAKKRVELKKKILNDTERDEQLKDHMVQLQGAEIEMREKYKPERLCLFEMLDRADLMLGMDSGSRDKIFKKLVALADRTGRGVLELPHQDTSDEAAFLKIFAKAYEKGLKHHEPPNRPFTVEIEDFGLKEGSPETRISSLIVPGMELFSINSQNRLHYYGVSSANELAQVLVTLFREVVRSLQLDKARGERAVGLKKPPIHPAVFELLYVLLDGALKNYEKIRGEKVGHDYTQELSRLLNLVRGNVGKFDEDGLIQVGAKYFLNSYVQLEARGLFKAINAFFTSRRGNLQDMYHWGPKLDVMPVPDVAFPPLPWDKGPKSGLAFGQSEVVLVEKNGKSMSDVEGNEVAKLVGLQDSVKNPSVTLDAASVDVEKAEAIFAEVNSGLDEILKIKRGEVGVLTQIVVIQNIWECQDLFRTWNLFKPKVKIPERLARLLYHTGTQAQKTLDQGVKYANTVGENSAELVKLWGQSALITAALVSYNQEPDKDDLVGFQKQFEQIQLARSGSRPYQSLMQRFASVPPGSDLYTQGSKHLAKARRATFAGKSQQAAKPLAKLKTLLDKGERPYSKEEGWQFSQLALAQGLLSRAVKRLSNLVKNKNPMWKIADQFIRVSNILVAAINVANEFHTNLEKKATDFVTKYVVPACELLVKKYPEIDLRKIEDENRKKAFQMVPVLVMRVLYGDEPYGTFVYEELKPELQKNWSQMFIKREFYDKQVYVAGLYAVFARLKFTSNDPKIKKDKETFARLHGLEQFVKYLTKKKRETISADKEGVPVDLRWIKFDDAEMKFIEELILPAVLEIAGEEKIFETKADGEGWKVPESLARRIVFMILERVDLMRRLKVADAVFKSLIAMVDGKDEFAEKRQQFLQEFAKQYRASSQNIGVVLEQRYSQAGYKNWQAEPWMVILPGFNILCSENDAVRANGVRQLARIVTRLAVQYTHESTKLPPRPAFDAVITMVEFLIQGAIKLVPTEETKMISRTKKYVVSKEGFVGELIKLCRYLFNRIFVVESAGALQRVVRTGLTELSAKKFVDAKKSAEFFLEDARGIDTAFQYHLKDVYPRDLVSIGLEK